jgi:hypothetical protein
MTQDTIEKTFNVSGMASLKLTNIRGLVEVHPGDAGVIRIHVTKYVDTGDIQKTEIEIYQAGDGTVVATTHFRDGWWYRLTGARPCKVDYLVSVPQDCHIKLRGVENSVFVEGLKGEFELATVSGKLSLQDLTGEVHIDAVSGDVSINRLSGQLDLTTVSGALDAKDTHLAAINAHTTSGNLKIQTSLSDGPYNFNSVSGDVRLLLPRDTRCSARLQSLNGSISTTFASSNASIGQGSRVVDIQGGGVMIDAASVSGCLRLTPYGDVPPIENTPEAPARVDTREILDRIERGEISADEALKHLKS